MLMASTRTSSAVATRVSCLDHETLDDAVDDVAVVVTLPAVHAEVLHRLGTPLVVVGGLWWFVVAFGGLWWLLVVVVFWWLWCFGGGMTVFGGFVVNG